MCVCCQYNIILMVTIIVEIKVFMYFPQLLYIIIRLNVIRYLITTVDIKIIVFKLHVELQLFIKIHQKPRIQHAHRARLRYSFVFKIIRYNQSHKFIQHTMRIGIKLIIKTSSNLYGFRFISIMHFEIHYFVLIQ